MRATSFALFAFSQHLIRCAAFTVQPQHRTCSLSRISKPRLSPMGSTSQPPLDGSDADREYARVRRRRRGRYEEEDEEMDDGELYDNDNNNVDDIYDRRRRRRRSREEAVYDNEDWINYDELDELLDDDDDNDDDYIYDEEEYDLLSNVLIPNPLLDSMDPDGAAERFPELASDPRFWFDMVLFVAFLNFLSFCGPQDPFPDIPWYY